MERSLEESKNVLAEQKAVLETLRIGTLVNVVIFLVGILVGVNGIVHYMSVLDTYHIWVTVVSFIPVIIVAIKLIRDYRGIDLHKQSKVIRKVIHFLASLMGMMVSSVIIIINVLSLKLTFVLCLIIYVGILLIVLAISSKIKKTNRKTNNLT